MILCFEKLKNDFKNSKKLKCFNIFVFFIKVSIQSEKSLCSSIPVLPHPLVQPFPFKNKIVPAFISKLED